MKHRLLMIVLAGSAALCGCPQRAQVDQDDLIRESDPSARRIEELQDEIDRLRAEASARELTIDRLRQREQALAQEIGQVRRENRALSDQLGQLGDCILQRDRLQQRVNELEARLQALQPTTATAPADAP